MFFIFMVLGVKFSSNIFDISKLYIMPNIVKLQMSQSFSLQKRLSDSFMESIQTSFVSSRFIFKPDML
jgi:hypothetical protein